MSTILALSLPSTIDGLTHDEQAEYQRLAQVWQATAPRNSLRMSYYLGHNRLKDLDISIPPSLKHTETVVGWPAKAVDMLAARSMFDGFVSSKDQENLFGLPEILEANQFDAAYDQAVRSQLIHCTAFWTVTPGDDSAGEPKVLIALRSAEFAAALWDFRLRRIRSGLAIVDMSADNPAVPTELNLYFDEHTIVARKLSNNQWKAERLTNVLGRPAMEPMPFQPDYLRPFGRSRITREVMSITDSGQRAALREEVLMEFNTAPQKAILGAEESAFDEKRWKTYMSSMLAITRDEDGQLPTLMQLPQLSPQGAIQYMQHLAMRFAGATSIPVSSLGVIQDNPASAEAIFAAKDDLVATAHTLNRYNRISLVTVAKMALAVNDNIRFADIPTEYQTLQARFRNPAMPSVVSQSDGMVKQISAIPWLAETDVALEELGYDESQIMRLLDQKRKAEAGSVLDRILESRKAPTVTVDMDRGREPEEV